MLLRKRIALGVVCLLLFLIVGFVGYLVIEALLRQERVQVAEQIELAVLQTCSLQVTVEPKSVTLYDVPYWSNERQDLDPEEGAMITCFMTNNNDWQCNCVDP